MDKHPNRDLTATARTPKQKGFDMKKFGFASAIAAGFAAAVFGLAAPAQADVVHHQWVHDIQQHASVGSVTPVFGDGR
ncbi:hypothetical protein [Mycolicibacterium mageritense]|uniref:hypothetical protein n=1 Tax=Mycolicibacterium mageritense TaxID=53462 RepID=UPI0023F44125|nr:hypothetical protein [Mycolicibacterium mageritense]